MNLLFLTISIALLGLVESKAQDNHLPETPFLGVEAYPLNAQIASSKGLTDTSGLLVVDLYPNNTAALMGIQAGDVLLSMQGTSLTSIPALREVLPATGDKVTVKLRRDGKTLRRKGRVYGRRFDLEESVSLRKMAVPFQDGLLRSFCFEPQEAGPQTATLFLLQGYPCQHDLHAPDWTSYHQLALRLARKGYRVYRMEKPGMGDSRNTPDCAAIDYETELDAFRAGLSHLQSLEGVDPERIFLLGHSLGGLTAPLLAREAKVAGVMVYGITYEPWLDYLEDNFRYQPVWFGVGAAQAEARVQRMRPLLRTYLNDGLSPEALIAEYPALDTLLYTQLDYDGQSQIMKRHWSFWPGVNRFNWPEVWSQTGAPMLAMYGDADIAALDGFSCQQTVQALNQQNAGIATYHEFKDVNHHMVSIDRETNLEILLTPQYRPYCKEHFSEKVVKYMHAWLQQQLLKVNG